VTVHLVATQPCLRCQGALERRQLWDLRVDVCPRCRFVALAQTDLPRLLESLSAELARRLDPDVDLKPVPDRAEGGACPGCRRPMEKADYCEANLVFFDRCESCGRLWVGSDELAAMSFMWARMETRSTRTRALIADDLALMDLLWFAHFSLR
jgi:Zn-finger nucleic acid-binding protein